MSTPSASESRDQLAERLKERVYVTFTTLAVLMALSSHGDNPEPGSIALSLLLTTVGVLLAGFAADVIAHSAIHAALPTGPALRHMARVAVGAFGAIVAPLILMLLAGIEAIPVSGAVIASQIVLVVALAHLRFPRTPARELHGLAQAHPRCRSRRRRRPRRGHPAGGALPVGACAPGCRGPRPRWTSGWRGAPASRCRAARLLPGHQRTVNSQYWPTCCLQRRIVDDIPIIKRERQGHHVRTAAPEGHPCGSGDR